MMKVTAHRGFSASYPENTMIAFTKAVQAGCDEIELDVQLTKDGEAVIIHDETIDRTTGKRGFVRDYSWEELRRIPTNNGFNPSAQGDAFIPSFEAYCQWACQTGITTNIELKTSVYYYKGLEEIVTALVKQYDLQERVIYSSFNHLSLLRCRQLDPTAKCGALVSMPGLGNSGYYCKTNGFAFYHPHRLSLSDVAVNNCYAHGIEINAWTVDDSEEIAQMDHWGCRSIITNKPDACRKWLDSHRAGGSATTI